MSEDDLAKQDKQQMTIEVRITFWAGPRDSTGGNVM